MSGSITLSAGFHSFEVKFYENGYGGSGLDVYLPSGVTYIRATTTDSNGHYAFAGIGPGSYTIQEVQQSGYIPTTPSSLDVTTTSGLDSTSSDFGQFEALTLSGAVYDDLNGDGAPGAGEPGLAGWTIDLIDGSNTVIATATAGPDGHYTLHAPSAGTYTVREETPSGYVVTSPSSGSYTETIDDSTSLGNLDFGNFLTIAVSGQVFADVNGNGQPDSGEPGLSGWTVDLLDGSDTVIANTSTDSKGNYAFSDLGPGTYSLAVEAPAGYVASGSPTNLPISATSGRDVSGEDFGEFHAVTLSGEVFDDSDGNGQINGGEAGLSGWTVDLVNAANQVVASVTTSSGGSYQFLGVGPGTDTIRAVSQAGYVATASPFVETPTSGLNLSGLNLGEAVASTASGEVFHDLNGDGTLGAGDPGLSGWTVDIVDGRGQLVAAPTTDPAGNFSFGALAPGLYTVTVSLMSGYVQTTSPTRYSLSVAEGTNLTQVNFGVFQAVTLSGEVFDDTNDDGSLTSGESGLSGWTVDLFQGSSLVASTTTDSGGNYSFPNVGPGSFTIKDELQAGYVATNSNALAVTTSSGHDVSGLDLGDLQGETLSGRVFTDLNGDGSFDGADSGLAGWTIDFLDGSNTVVGTAMTDSTGAYTFTTITPGTYLVKPVVPTNDLITAPASGTYSETLTAGQTVSGLDFGAFLTVAFSGTVYNDVTGDGTPNGNDTGLSGWTVSLLDGSNAVLATTSTDSTGAYRFSDLGPGSYSIAVTARTGYVGTSAGTEAETAVSGGDVSGVNFGEFRQVSVGGEVFNDLNGDGSAEAGDAGLSGWSISLLDGASTVIATATTDSKGAYAFANLGPGSFAVTVSPRAGFVGTSAATIPVATRSGQDVTSANFGEFQAVSLTGEVFLDANGDSLPDNGEGGLSGWTVNLLNSSGQTIGSILTPTGGAFSFPGQGPGRYTIQVVGQYGYVVTTSPLVVTTSSGQDLTNLNIGEFRTVSLAGEVFGDANDNGSLDQGETGLAGWTVNLLNSSNGVVQTATTDSQGGYSFAIVGPGRFTVAEALQAGYVQTRPSSGGIAVTTSSGVNLSGEDFGIVLGPVLSVANLGTSPSSGLTSGTPLTISWDDVNNGGLPVNASFTDLLTITDTTTGQVLAAISAPYNESARGAVPIGGSAHQSATFTLPDGASGVGNIQFTVTADSSGSVSNGLPTSGRTSSIAEPLDPGRLRRPDRHSGLDRDHPHGFPAPVGRHGHGLLDRHEPGRRRRGRGLRRLRAGPEGQPRQ